MTHEGAMMAPPHAGMVAYRRETCHGHEWAHASFPPMILVSISSSGVKVRIPVNADDRKVHVHAE